MFKVEKISATHFINSFRVNANKILKIGLILDLVKCLCLLMK